MSKKTLKDGLESLFGMPPSDVMEETAFLGDNVKAPRKVKPKKRRTSRPGSSGSSKSFTADLESLFQTVVSESVAAERKKATTETDRPFGNDLPASERASRKPMNGLDALIRETVEPNKKQIQQQATLPKEKKRVTFVFDKRKLAKLKQIAKLEKAYLKDIIGGLISEYLDEYDAEKEK